jgi:hypothetical protein
MGRVAWKIARLPFGGFVHPGAGCQSVKVRAQDARSALKHRPADVVPQPLVIKYELANSLRQLITLPLALDRLAAGVRRWSVRIGAHLRLAPGCDELDDIWARASVGTTARCVAHSPASSASPAKIKYSERLACASASAAACARAALRVTAI